MCYCCSIKEPGLYDYVIFNDDLEDAFAQLVLVAKRALSGKTGNGSQSITGPVTLVAEEEPSKAPEASAAAAAPVPGASAQASRLMGPQLHDCWLPLGACDLALCIADSSRELSHPSPKKTDVL